MSAINTLETFFAQRTTSLAAGVRHDFSAITVQAPETVGRTFVSVHLEIMFHDDSGAATAISSWLIGIKLGAAAFSDVTVTDSMAFGSETKGYVLRSGNLASYFNTNFGAGATQTCQVGIQFGTAPTINHTCKLVYTYSYDWESCDTRAGMLLIPVESWDAYLSTVQTQIGTNQLPRLTGTGGLLEGVGSASVKDVWLVLDTHSGREDNVNLQLAVQIDSEAEVLDGVHNQALISHYRYRYVYSFAGKSASYWDSAHAIKARGTQNGWFKAAIFVYVIYTYSESGTTGNCVQSIRVPFEMPELMVHTTEGYLYADVDVEVQEPGTITLLQSGVQFLWKERYGTTQVNVQVGAQTVKQYYVTTTPGGMSTQGLTHRIDSGSSAGAFGTLSRGKNTIRIKLAINAGFDSLLWSVSGMLVLNYRSSSKASDTFRHARTVTKHVQATTDNAAGTRYASTSLTFHTGEAWRLFAAAFWTVFLSPNSTAVATVGVEVAAGLFKGLLRDYLFGSSNLEVYQVLTPYHQYLQRNSADVDTNRQDPTAARDWRVAFTGDGGSSPCFAAAHMHYTFHGISYSVSGNISGYTGTGSGITVDIYNATTKELLASVTSVIGGGFSATVYDNTQSVYAVARQSSIRLGRSENGTPGVSTFNINIGKADNVAPSLTIVSPSVGVAPGEPGGFPADYETAKDTEIHVIINDTGPGISDMMVVRVLASGALEPIWFDGAFVYPYNLQSSSSVSTTSIELHIRYNGGWPPDTGQNGINLKLIAFDTAGNRMEEA